jgi:hypothetical protein
MPDEKRSSGPLSQVLVAVTIALLVGGTAPWWWHDLRSLFARSAREVVDGRGTGSDRARADPEKTVRELIAAWNRRDRSAAVEVAEPGAIETLFGAPALAVSSKEVTCYPVGTGQRDCQVAHTRGAVVFRLRETDRGWRVERVDY